MSKPVPTAIPSSTPIIEVQEQISIRAFELYEQRGRTDGHDLDDWLQAEAEFRQPKGKGVAA